MQQRSVQCTAQCTKESPGALPSSPFGVSGTSKGATTDRRATIEVSSSSFLPSYVTVVPNYKNPPGIDSFWFLLKSSFSEKATKIRKNLPLVLTLLSKNSCFVKSGGRFFQILWPSHNVSTHLFSQNIHEIFR